MPVVHLFDGGLLWERFDLGLPVRLLRDADGCEIAGALRPTASFRIEDGRVVQTVWDAKRERWRP